VDYPWYALDKAMFRGIPAGRIVENGNLFFGKKCGRTNAKVVCKRREDKDCSCEDKSEER
jgi:hypothetical protein